MKVPLLDLGAQLKPIRTEVLSAIEEVVDSTRYVMGPKVQELEEKIADYVGAKYACGVSSGTDALLISLMALEVSPGDIVLTTPYSFFATAGVISRLNAQPVFIDIDKKSYNICPDSLKQWFSDNPNLIEKVKAIVPVHLYGQCADMDPINAVAQEHGIPVVEDAAQAIGAGYPSKAGHKKAGALGELCCFSFFPSKNLGAMGDGGLVTTNDEALIERLRMLRLHGSKPKYYHSIIGGNFRLDPLQAAVLLVKFNHLENWHQGRQDNAHYYDEALNVPNIEKPVPIWGRENHVYNQYVVTVPNKRDDLRKFLSEAQIGNEVYYPLSFHEQECFKDLGYKRGDFPNSEYAADHTIALPIYPELTHEMQDYVISKLGEFYGC